MTIRPATIDDLKSFYSKPLGETVRAIVAELDGEVVGVAGVFRSEHQIFAFSEMRDALRKRKKDIVRMLHRFKPILQKYHTVTAVADPDEPTSRGFLEKIGFEHYGPSEHGEVYIWVTGTKQ